jgi:hypothetical protein
LTAIEDFVSCIADEHRICGKIKPLDVVAKGVKSATMFEDFASEVKYCFNQTKDLFFGPVFCNEIEFM